MVMASIIYIFAFYDALTACIAYNCASILVILLIFDAKQVAMGDGVGLFSGKR